MNVLPSGNTDVWLTRRSVLLSAPTKARLFSRSVWHSSSGTWTREAIFFFPVVKVLVLLASLCSIRAGPVSLHPVSLEPPLPHPLDAKGTSRCGQRHEPIRGGPSAVGVTVPSEPGTDTAPAR